MTANDEAILAQAGRLTTANYWDGETLKEQCDSDDARCIIDGIMRRLYHYEEAESDMI